jgi:hypothetical protein
MPEEIDGQRIRSVLLELAHEWSNEPNRLQELSFLNEAARRLGIRSGRHQEFEQAVLTVWHDLFRTGHLAWGIDLNNIHPFFHVTSQGRRTLEHLSRDPANPDGYLAHLRDIGMMSPVTDSYLQEALRTYNTDCFKAAAVMIGVAVESIILELRDALVQRMMDGGNPPGKSNALRANQIKEIQRGLKNALESRQQDMPDRLRERYESYWNAFVQQIRLSRNETGHPNSIEPVTIETVHSSLLIFPEILRTAVELKVWIVNSY